MKPSKYVRCLPLFYNDADQKDLLITLITLIILHAYHTYYTDHAHLPIQQEIGKECQNKQIDICLLSALTIFMMRTHDSLVTSRYLFVVEKEMHSEHNI